MDPFFDEALKELKNIVDVVRFGMTEATKAGLYYGHGTDNVQDDMWALVLGSLSLSLDCGPLLMQSRLTSAEKRHLAAQLQARIVRRVPVPYLTQKAYFCGMSFYVDPRVLIPRSPIAELIQRQFQPWLNPDRVQHVLDLCTGSGCIAIALCHAFPNALVDAVDLSEDALAVAAINRAEHGLGEEGLQLIASDCWEKVPNTRYDLIVSNPPYVGDVEMASLPQEYLHEPDTALRTANNGLYLVEKILAHAHQYLNESGILVVEVGNSEDVLVEAYPEMPFTWLDFENGGQGVFLLTAQQLRDYHFSKASA